MSRSPEKPPSQFPCPYCLVVYGSQEALDLHLKSKRNQQDINRKDGLNPILLNDGKTVSTNPQILFQLPANYYSSSEYHIVGMASLSIGQWKQTSKILGDLEAKFASEERLLIWEFNTLKESKRIIVPLENIIGLKVDENSLAVQLAQKPTFLRADLQDLIWKTCLDFTDEGAASKYNIHVAQFPETHKKKLESAIESLFRCSFEMETLNKQSFPSDMYSLYINN